MKKIILGLILAISLNAGFVDGNTLVQWMSGYKKSVTNNDYYDSAQFTSYIFGVVDTLRDINYVCLPPNVRGQQLFAITIKYIDEHPKDWNQPAHILVGNAMINTFPCKK